MNYLKFTIPFCISTAMLFTSCTESNNVTIENSTTIPSDSIAKEDLINYSEDTVRQIQASELELIETVSNSTVNPISTNKNSSQNLPNNSSSTIVSRIVPAETVAIVETEIKFSHELWDNLLRKNVTTSGNVNYKNFVEDKNLLLEYITLLEKNPPTTEWTKKEKLAFWINAYNAFTIKTIVDHFPTKSIMDIDKAWDQKNCKIGDKNYSLSQIENDILRKMNEPRIHFAINCASVSCPKLFNHAFDPENLESQLKDATLAFINDPTKNNISADQLKISKIFEWYAADFSNGNIIEFLNGYKAGVIQSNATISYLEYDWSLND